MVVVLCNQIEPAAMIEQIRQFNAPAEERRTTDPEKNSKDLRTIGLGSQILSELGVRKMIVMSAPKRFHALSGFGLEVVDWMTP